MSKGGCMKEIKAITINGKNVGWIDKDELDLYNKFRKRQERKWMFYMNTPGAMAKNTNRIIDRDRRVFAYILVGNSKMLCYYDKETKKAYKHANMARTWIEWKKFTFIRFCTSMDI